MPDGTGRCGRVGGAARWGRRSRWGAREPRSAWSCRSDVVGMPFPHEPVCSTPAAGVARRSLGAAFEWRRTRKSSPSTSRTPLDCCSRSLAMAAAGAWLHGSLQCAGIANHAERTQDSSMATTPGSLRRRPDARCEGPSRTTFRRRRRRRRPQAGAMAFPAPLGEVPPLAVGCPDSGSDLKWAIEISRWAQTPGYASGSQVGQVDLLNLMPEKETGWVVVAPSSASWPFSERVALPSNPRGWPVVKYGPVALISG